MTTVGLAAAALLVDGAVEVVVIACLAIVCAAMLAFRGLAVAGALDGVTLEEGREARDIEAARLGTEFREHDSR